jgi:hypothetical protein
MSRLAQHKDGARILKNDAPWGADRFGSALRGGLPVMFHENIRQSAAQNRRECLLQHEEMQRFCPFWLQNDAFFTRNPNSGMQRAADVS